MHNAASTENACEADYRSEWEGTQVLDTTSTLSEVWVREASYIHHTNLFNRKGDPTMTWDGRFWSWVLYTIGILIIRALLFFTHPLFLCFNEAVLIMSSFCTQKRSPASNYLRMPSLTALIL